MHARAREALLAGVIAPLLLSAVLVALTVHQREFLEASGWSAVRRTPVEWPSLLMLGPGGWLLVVALVVCGALGLIFARGLYEVAPTRAIRAGALLIALLAAAVTLEAFRPDPPAAAATSWHDTLHRGIYPLIPICALAAAALFAAAPRIGWWRGVRRLAVVAVVVMAVAVVLTWSDPIAQLARYLFFGALLAWIEAIAVLASRSDGVLFHASRERHG